MTLEEYQISAMFTCMETCENFPYMFLNLVGEVGELASKIAKAIRKRQMTIQENDLCLYDFGATPVVSAMEHTKNWTWYEDGKVIPQYQEMDEELMKEAGDILWQLSGLCSVMGWDLDYIAQLNLAKLADRQKRNKIDGEGDNR